MKQKKRIEKNEVVRELVPDVHDGTLQVTPENDSPDQSDTGSSLKVLSDTARKSSEVVTSLDPGQHLSKRYEIIQKIGEGGMGAVYAARDTLRDEEIAIKVLLPRWLPSTEARERFVKEARLASNLSHPKIVRVFNIEEEAHRTFLTMELLEGETLRQRMARQRTAKTKIDLKLVRRIGQQMCDALQYAHDKHIIHRDVKPENIWLEKHDNLKLMDFGIARIYQDKHFAPTGGVVGTAYYMAPEQLRGESSIDGRADQFALGVVLYELLTGELPHGAVRPPHAVHASIPRNLSRAVMKAMATEPVKRHADMAAFSACLSRAIHPMTVAWSLIASIVLIISTVIAWPHRSILWKEPAKGAIATRLSNREEPSQEEVHAKEAEQRRLVDQQALQEKTNELQQSQESISKRIADLQSNDKTISEELFRWPTAVLNRISTELDNSQVAALSDELVKVETFLNEIPQYLSERKDVEETFEKIHSSAYPDRPAVDDLQDALRLADSQLGSGKLLEGQTRLGSVKEALKPRLEGLRVIESKWREVNLRFSSASRSFSLLIQQHPSIDRKWWTWPESELKQAEKAMSIAEANQALDSVENYIRRFPRYIEARKEVSNRLKSIETHPLVDRTSWLSLTNSLTAEDAKLEHGKIDDAIAVLERIRKDMDTQVVALERRQAIEVKALVDSGKVKLREKNLDEAINEFTKALRIDSNFVPAIVANADARRERKDFKSALEGVNQALKLDDRSVEALCVRGEILREVRDFEAALESCNQAIGINNQFSDAYRVRGSIYFDMGNHDQASNDCNIAIKLDSTNSSACNTLGNVYRFKKETDQAIYYYKRAIQLNLKYALAYNNLGALLAERREFDEAIQYYSAAIEIDPRLAMAYSNRGYAYGEKSQFDQAIRDGSSAIQLNKNEPRFYWRRGAVYAGKGAYESNRGAANDSRNAYAMARNDFESALRLDGLSENDRRELEKNLNTIRDR